jgi:predicted transcriptional regulator
MTMTSETGASAEVQREPITLDEIKAKHDATTWPAVQAVKAERDDMIRTVLAAKTYTARQIAEALGISEQHVGRIERGETSGAAKYRNRPTDAAE